MKFVNRVRSWVIVCLPLLGAGIWISACIEIPRLPTPNPGEFSGGSGALPTQVVMSQLPSVTASIAPSPTASPPSTMSHTPANAESPSPGKSPIPSQTATFTPRPTKTPPPTTSPTVQPRILHNVATFQPYVDPSRGPTATPPTAVPTAVPTFELPAGATNILLLGSDEEAGGVSRADSIIIVSVNSRQKTAAMLSLPRDLYVHIPGWTMGRINQAIPVGDGRGHPEGGIGSLKDTILYNFGIPVHYYARIDFDGFKEIIDAIGGLEMAVSCELTDWRLKSPDLDIHVEENWERFTLKQGVHHMDGDLALWYARSRLSTDDFDRNLRQQRVLQAILNQGVDLGLAKEVPSLWSAFQNTVETDMDIGRMLQLSTIAPTVRTNGVQHLHLIYGDIVPWTIPDTNSTVYLPNWFFAQQTVKRLFVPASLNRGNRAPLFVEVVNHTGDEEMAALAADNLAWYGILPVIAEPDQTDAGAIPPNTELIYYGQNFKGSYDWLVSWIFDMGEADIELDSETESEYDYQVVLGADFDPCRPLRYSPREFLDN